MQRWNPDKPVPLAALAPVGHLGVELHHSRTQRSTLKQAHRRKSRRGRGRIVARAAADYFGSIDRG